MTRLHKGLIWGSAIVLLAAIGLVATSQLFAGLIVVAFYAALTLILLVVERAGYKRLLDAPPGPSWRASEERFVDPETGRLVTVWQEPGSGRRAYVASGKPQET